MRRGLSLADIPNVKTGPPLDEVYWSNARSSGVVLQAAADLHLRRVVYTSTCQIYGMPRRRVPPKYLPVDEAHPSYPSTRTPSPRQPTRHLRR